MRIIIDTENHGKTFKIMVQEANLQPKMVYESPTIGAALCVEMQMANAAEMLGFPGLLDSAGVTGAVRDLNLDMDAAIAEAGRIIAEYKQGVSANELTTHDTLTIDHNGKNYTLILKRPGRTPETWQGKKTFKLAMEEAEDFRISLDASLESDIVESGDIIVTVAAREAAKRERLTLVN